MTKCIEKQVGILTAIKPERHFIEVGREVLGANLVPCPHDSPLQEREGTFNCVCVNVANRVDALAVIDGLMPVGELSECSRISRKVVGHNYVHIFGDVLSDVLCKRPFPSVRCVEESQVAIPLADANYDLLVSSSLPSPILANSVQFSADIGFIHLNRSVEHGLAGFFHGGADAVTEIPSCLVATQTECALNLASTHALLRFTQQQGSQEPLRKWQVGIVEDRPGSYGELVVAILAVVERLFGFKLDSGKFAAQAADTFGPAQPSQYLPALLIGREHGVYIN